MLKGFLKHTSNQDRFSGLPIRSNQERFSGLPITKYIRTNATKQKAILMGNQCAILIINSL